MDHDGILRMDRRIANSNKDRYEVLYPNQLAKCHPDTELLVNEFHWQSKHLGIRTTITKIIMTGFGIPQARQAVKTALSKCPICKKYNSLSLKYPRLANLPKDHVNVIIPYENTGINYTEHL